ncbi:phosphotransferase [Devosia geojensis]|uniref:Phosphotransferase n=1 Tax=Devosia geojensis TaxID=443610 RepID=A0A0F5FV44_9HYPH|nr:AAA family ATPase [Devosia geojensis]KKB12751.1 phosphotransferase [Devosia geojensis]
MNPVYIITGAMAAGKSTVAKALVQRFERSAHVGGDAFLRMIVKGAAVMGPVLDAEARAQLTLRQEIATDVVRRYHAAGFAVVYQDILIGQDLVAAVDRLADLAPRVVVLAPNPQTLAERDAARAKTGYVPGFPPEVLSQALANETPRIGLWLDTSELDVDETVAAILHHHW